MITESVAYLRSHGLAVVYDAGTSSTGTGGSHLCPGDVESRLAGGQRSRPLRYERRLLPHVIQRLQMVIQATGAPVGIHTHNDCGVGVANALMAVKVRAAMFKEPLTAMANAPKCGSVPDHSKPRVKIGSTAMPMRVTTK